MSLQRFISRRIFVYKKTNHKQAMMQIRSKPQTYMKTNIFL